MTVKSLTVGAELRPRVADPRKRNGTRIRDRHTSVLDRLAYVRWLWSSWLRSFAPR